MKLITDQLYGDRRAYIGAIVVVVAKGGPTAAICVEIGGLGPLFMVVWTGKIMADFTFQPDPSKLAHGEWCWPVTTPPVPPERIKEVRRICAASYDSTKSALVRMRGEIAAAVALCGGEQRYMGKCNRVMCDNGATCRDDYDLSCWCDEHVPEGRTVWRRPEPAVITSQADADALLGKGALKVPDVQPQIYRPCTFKTCPTPSGYPCSIHGEADPHSGPLGCGNRSCRICF